MVAASISLRGVGRAFGATRALAGVDLDLEPGVTGQAAWPGLAGRPAGPGRRRARRTIPRRRLPLLLRGGSPQPETAEEVAS